MPSAIAPGTAQDSRRFLSATITLIGTIVGVGIFGVPYALSQAGVLVGVAFFVILGGIQLLQHLFYAEAAIATDEPLRLVGLIERYVGKRAKHIAVVATVLGFWAGMLAYMIVGGIFLHALLTPMLGGNVFAYQIAWGVLGAAAVYFGLDVITRIDVAATIGLILAMLIIFVFGAPYVRLENLPLHVGKDLFLPYGVILFSLSGLPAILEMEDVLKGKHRSYRLAVTAGTVVSILLTAAFGFMVWGITGATTTQDSASGLTSVIGPGIATVVAVFGFLAVATSFFATAINLQSTFEYDYKLKRFWAWLLTGGIPLAALVAGTKDFVAVVSFSGAVFGGIIAVLVAMLYVAVTKGKFMKEKPLGAPLWAAYASIAVLVVGAAYETVVAAMHLF